jgi:4-hydroxy-3-methylbut-2-enyl diphosphate reductase IspH
MTEFMSPPSFLSILGREELPHGAVFVLSARGAPPTIRYEAKSLALQVIDATS